MSFVFILQSSKTESNPLGLSSSTFAPFVCDQFQVTLSGRTGHMAMYNKAYEVTQQIKLIESLGFPSKKRIALQVRNISISGIYCLLYLYTCTTSSIARDQTSSFSEGFGGVERRLLFLATHFQSLLSFLVSLCLAFLNRRGPHLGT